MDGQSCDDHGAEKIGGGVENGRSSFTFLVRQETAAESGRFRSRRGDVSRGGR
jgi:hypothetical protein